MTNLHNVKKYIFHFNSEKKTSIDTVVSLKTGALEKYHYLTKI